MIKHSICYFLLFEIIYSQGQSSHECPTGCDECNGCSGNCSKCETGYYLSGSSCYAYPSGVCTCQKPCDTCQTNSLICQTCIDPSKQEPDSCQCKVGYFMITPSYLYGDCPTNCLTCSSTTWCTQCQDNYQNINGQCLVLQQTLFNM